MKHLNLLLIALGITFLSSCYPYDSVYIDELDATITTYDTTVTDWSVYKKYVIRDSVILIHNDWVSDSQVAEWYAAGGSSDAIRDMVIAKLNSQGYQKVDDLQDADIAINISMFAVEYTTYYYPGWWWGYPGYWPPYWGPYYKSDANADYYYPWYPYYPSYTYYTSYEGLLLVEMIDASTIIDDPEENPEIRFIWEAGVQGSLTSDNSYNKERIQRGLDEAFEQSPYLSN